MSRGLRDLGCGRGQPDLAADAGYLAGEAGLLTRSQEGMLAPGSLLQHC